MEDTDVEIAVVKEQFSEILRRLTVIDGRIETQNGRVRRLEEWRWKAGGAIAVMGLAAAYLLK